MRQQPDTTGSKALPSSPRCPKKRDMKQILDAWSIIDRRKARYAKNWTNGASKRWHALVVKEALGRITQIQEEELNYLQRLRRES